MAIVVTVGCASASPSSISSESSAASPQTGWTGCSGEFDTNANPTGVYFVTDFGCSSSPSFTDTSDNCCPSGVVQASATGLCPTGVTTEGCTSSVGTSSAIACEREVNWFSTGGSAFGLGTRLRLTRPDTGVSVVVFVIDNGPACFREQQFGGYALDISYPAIMALYGQEEGVSDRAVVEVTVLASNAPLGPDTGSAPAGPVIAAVPEAGAPRDGGRTHGADAAQVDAGLEETTSPMLPVIGDDAGNADTGNDGDEVPCADDGDCNPGPDGSGQFCSGGTCVAGCDADGEGPGDTSCVSGTCQ